MAYHGRPYQQAPSDSFHRNGEGSYNPPLQHATAQYTNHHNLSDNSYYDRPARAPRPYQDGNFWKSRVAESNGDNSQWSEQNASWAPRVQQSYINPEEDARNTDYRMCNYQGARQERLTGQHGASNRALATTHQPYQDLAWSRPSPVGPSHRNRSYKPRERKNREEPSPNGGHNGALPQADEYRTPTKPMMMGQNHVTGHEHRSATKDKPPSPFKPQQQAWTAQNRGPANPGRIPDYGHGNVEVPTQPRFPVSGNGISNKPGK